MSEPTTFAAHSYFVKQGWAVQTTGVEVRSGLVKSMNAVVAQLGANFSELRFECAPVAEYLAIMPALTAAVWWFKNCLCMCYVGGLLVRKH